jgi:hypothetical protein
VSVPYSGGDTGTRYLSLETAAVGKLPPYLPVVLRFISRLELPVTLTHPSGDHSERSACITSTRAARAAGRDLSSQVVAIPMTPFGMLMNFP